MIEFKRGVYQQALSELSHLLPRQEQPRTRFLRAHVRHQRGQAAPGLRGELQAELAGE